MNIFLTGGSGFIGKSFLDTALKNGHKIFAVSRKKRISNYKNLIWLKGNIAQDWKKYLKKTDIIVHLAAAGVTKSSKVRNKEIFNLNVIKSSKLILNGLNYGCKKFLIASSSSEYANDGLVKKKLSLNSVRSGDTFYSQSKIYFSDLIENISKIYNAKFRIMRIFPTYGLNEPRHRLYPYLIDRAKKNKNAIIKNPNEIRDFNDVKYVAKVLNKSIFFNKYAKKFEIYHISSNQSMSVRKFSEIIWKQQKAKGKLVFKNYDKTHKRHVSDYQSTWKINDKKI